MEGDNSKKEETIPRPKLVPKSRRGALQGRPAPSFPEPPELPPVPPAPSTGPPRLPPSSWTDTSSVFTFASPAPQQQQQPPPPPTTPDSAYRLTAAALHEASTVVDTAGFVPSTPTPMAADADSLLAREKAAKEQVESEYHEILTRKESEIDALKKEEGNLRHQLNKLRADLRQARDTVETVNSELNRLQSSNNDLALQVAGMGEGAQASKSAEAKNQGEIEKLTGQVSALIAANMKINAKNAEADAIIRSLRDQVANHVAQAEQDANTIAQLNDGESEQVADIVQDLAEIFPDLGEDCGIEDYVLHVRSLESTRIAEAEDAHDDSPGTIHDELGGAELEGSDDEADAHSVQQPQLGFSEIISVSISPVAASSPVLPPQDSQQLGFSSIPSVDFAPAQPASPHQDPETFNFSPISSEDSEPISPLQEHFNFSGVLLTDTAPLSPTPQVLDFSPIVSIETVPVAPAPQHLSLGSLRTLETIPIAPPPIQPRVIIRAITNAEIWERMPIWAKITLLALIGFFISLFVAVTREYTLWTSANDLTRQHLLDITNGYYGNLHPSPFIFSVGSYLGVDFKMLG